MLDSKNQDHIYGALLAINKVVRIGRETRIVHRVKSIMPFVLKQLSANKEEYLVERTAECLGILAEAGGKITAEAVNEALMTVIQFLDDDRDPNSKNIKKYSAVLVLREFCKKLSIITFNKLFDSKKHFRLIFFTLKDKREKVRTTAADCIKECIRMINARDYQNDQKRDYLDLIYKEVQ
jgi:hypothetical protein